MAKLYKAGQNYHVNTHASGPEKASLSRAFTQDFALLCFPLIALFSAVVYGHAKLVDARKAPLALIAMGIRVGYKKEVEGHYVP